MPVDVGAFESKIDRSGEHHLWTGAVDGSGTGQIRVDGKLRSPVQIVWELKHGLIPDGHRVYACPEVRLCVHTDHIFTKPYGKQAASDRSRTRAERGSGSIRPVGENKWKLTIDAGRDERGNRRRVTRVVEGTKAQASRALAALSVQVQTGERVPAQHGSAMTVAELVDWYVSFARDVRGLEWSEYSFSRCQAAVVLV